MLRIIRIENATERRWVLCGQLAGRWVQEFRLQWREFGGSGVTDEAGAALDPRPASAGEHATMAKGDVVDLTDVTFIDEEGEALLGQMKYEGVHLIAGSGVENRDLLENLRTKDRRPVRRMLGRMNERC
jgi:hypothetical protein